MTPRQQTQARYYAANKERLQEANRARAAQKKTYAAFMAELQTDLQHATASFLTQYCLKHGGTPQDLSESFLKWANKLSLTTEGVWNLCEHNVAANRAFTEYLKSLKSLKSLKNGTA